MRLLSAVVISACLGLTSAPLAHASSPDAWAALFKKAEAACKKASGLKDSAMIGKPVDFSSAVLVRIEGIWPQPHMKAAKAKFACLYTKRTHRAEAAESVD